MIKVSSSALLYVFVKLLIFLAIAKVITLLVLWYLPSDGIELSVKTSKQPKYQRVDFKNMIRDAQSSTKATQTANTNVSVNINITNMLLKGFYGKGTAGWAILALKLSPKKTSIISVGEEFSSYTLKFINATSVVFEKEGKEYTLNLEETKQSSSISKIPAAIAGITQTNKISRADIKHYSKNPKQMWKDISLVDYKENNKLIGFKIQRINRDSKFATLGLKAQDIIIKVNNVALESYKEVFDVYNKMDKLDTIQIVVLRRNQEKEFVYEIN